MSGRIQRDVGGTREVAVGDGRKSLDVGAQDLGHGLPLGLAQFRELLGDMGYRAVVLADLHTLDRPAHSRGGGGIAGIAQRVGDTVRLAQDPRFDVPSSCGSTRGTSARMVSIRRRAKVWMAASPPISRSCRMAADARSS